MDSTPISTRTTLRQLFANHKVFLVCAFAMLVVRVGLSKIGHNYDFESWEIVANLMLDGKDVYSATERYNYAPLWMWVLYALKSITAYHFRFAVAVFTSVVDIAIAGVLYQRGNKKAAWFILFSPLCVIISGYHNQFDNLAILVALLAVRYAETRKGYEPSVKGWGINATQTFFLALVVGLSLVAKHLLIFLPLWFLMHKQLTVKQKLILFVVPYATFMLSFLPYLASKQGILTNVFLYDPQVKAPLYRLFLGTPIIDLLNAVIAAPFRKLFFIILTGSGFFMRKKPLMEMLAFYFAFVVLFASNLFVHYLIIPMLFLAYFESRFWKLYNLVGLSFLCYHPHIFGFEDKVTGGHQKFANYVVCYGYFFLITILLLAVVDVVRPGLLRYKTFKRWLQAYL